MCNPYVLFIIEGVCHAKKDYNLAKHPDIDVPNLQVIKLMQSFKSKEYVRETFAWMHYYWFLTNEGIEFLRTYLNLPAEIVPATLKKQARPAGARPFGGPPGDRPRYNSIFFPFLCFVAQLCWALCNCRFHDTIILVLECFVRCMQEYSYFSKNYGFLFYEKYSFSGKCYMCSLVILTRNNQIRISMCNGISMHP